jgi:aminopeptidase N
VSAVAARALGEIRSDRAFEALTRLVGVKHPKVRRAVVAALGDYRTEKAARLLVSLLEKGDPSVLVEAETARSAGRTRQSLVFDALAAALQRSSWRDQVRVGAIDGLARLRDERAVKLIDPFADDQPHLATRRAAVVALAEFGGDKRAIRERLEQLLDPNDPYFTPEVSRSLTRLRDAEAVGALTRLLRHSIDGRVQRHAREAIRDLQKHESPDEVRRLSDALDRLRDEHQALRDELGRVKTVLRLDGDHGADGATTKKSKTATARTARSKKALGGGRGGRKKSRAGARSKRGRS